MGFEIREADVVRELPLMRETLNANRDRETPLERFEWLYLRNPDGPARAWFAVDDRSGAVAGFTAVFPRRVRVRGHREPLVAWNCGDFSIHQQYRTGAAAVKLRRAARDAVDRGERPFLYAHPNDRMLPVHLRVGHFPLAQMIRFARPLRLSNGGIAGALSGAVLRLAGLDWVTRVRDEVEPVDGPLGTEFDELYDRAAPRLGTSLVRDATYLQWRFQCGPARQSEVLASRRGGRLSGYVAWSAQGNTAKIKDWVAIDPEAWNALFVTLIGRARARRLQSASVTALETNPDLTRFRRFGFKRRPETSTAISYAPEGRSYRPDVIQADAWFMTVGDRDI
jgi:Acetyltransferase (GNAT) domain